jgi:hypothetical protein
MKVASLALAIAIVAAGAALAKPTDVPRSGSHDAHMRSGHAHAQTSAAKTDPFGAYVNGKEIGRDPDPNIREELRNEYLWGGSRGARCCPRKACSAAVLLANTWVRDGSVPPRPARCHARRWSVASRVREHAAWQH